MFRRLIVLGLIALNAGCATITAAAISGGDRRAIVAGAAIDSLFLGALSSASQREREHERIHYRHPVQQQQVVVVHVHNHLPRSAEQPDGVSGATEARRPEIPSTPSIPEQRSREQVRSVLAGRMPELRRCQSLLPPAVGTSYSAYCRFRIRPDGVPVGVELRVHEPKPLRECVEEVIGQWRFPEASMSTSVSLPLSWPVYAENEGLE